LGSGRESGTATVSTTGGRTRMRGVFTNATGGRGTITATRKSTPS
jgi:hypothetical protein